MESHYTTLNLNEVALATDAGLLQGADLRDLLPRQSPGVIRILVTCGSLHQEGNLGGLLPSDNATAVATDAAPPPDHGEWSGRAGRNALCVTGKPVQRADGLLVAGYPRWLVAWSTTRRTSARHQRPSGCSVPHWHPPALLVATIRSRIVEQPLLLLTFSRMSSAEYSKQ